MFRYYELNANAAEAATLFFCAPRQQHVTAAMFMAFAGHTVANNFQRPPSEPAERRRRRPTTTTTENLGRTDSVAHSSDRRRHVDTFGRDTNLCVCVCVCYEFAHVCYMYVGVYVIYSFRRPYRVECACKGDGGFVRLQTGFSHRVLHAAQDRHGRCAQRRRVVHPTPNTNANTNTNAFKRLQRRELRNLLKNAWKT